MEATEIAEKIHGEEAHSAAADATFRKFTGIYLGIVAMLLAITALAVVGMAAFFTGVVQAPVTGIVLVIEMTASFTMLLPMIAACFTAMLVPNLIGTAPIYDSLRERTLRLQQTTIRPAGARAENSR